MKPRQSARFPFLDFSEIRTLGENILFHWTSSSESTKYTTFPPKGMPVIKRTCLSSLSRCRERERLSDPGEVSRVSNCVSRRAEGILLSRGETFGESLFFPWKQSKRRRRVRQPFFPSSGDLPFSSVLPLFQPNQTSYLFLLLPLLLPLLHPPFLHPFSSSKDVTVVLSPLSLFLLSSPP